MNEHKIGGSWHDLPTLLALWAAAIVGGAAAYGLIVWLGTVWGIIIAWIGVGIAIWLFQRWMVRTGRW